MRHRPPQHRRWLATLALSALVAGSAIWWYLPETSVLPPESKTAKAPALVLFADADINPPAVSSDASPTDTRTTVVEVASRTPASLGPDPYAASLKGTDIDGALKADSQGKLIVDLETRDFFDYFLNTVGEVSPDQVLEQIRTLAMTSLPPKAAAEAMALLDQYLQYKQEALAVQATPLDPSRQNDPNYRLEMLEKAFIDLKLVRQGVFSPDAHQAFFGLEEAYGEYTLATLGIAARTDLSAEAKTSMVAWHRDQLPSQLQQTERHLLASTEKNRHRIATIDAAESPEAAGQKLMAQGMSPDAAASVTDYLQERATFDARYQHYEAALDQLRDSGLTDTDVAAQQAHLLNQHFPDQKQQTWARLKMLGSN
ncbi:lipase chaperone [Marinobacter alexandrii]|uniref:lipase secretion chaperone n=1 Tax=Marinobacter alexandrii TaxID=2570351 RepID=UPI001FFFD0CD|nr:lipase secretion chaperone [Marinobacter alexandrii]MCK2150809.1 lipase chaperone [Marinobacter alexandrii]